MTIRPLRYHSYKDEIIGFDKGFENESEKVATSALVFMVRGLNHRWKQIVGYMFVYNGMPGAVQRIKVIECIQKLNSISGLNVVALVL